MEEQFYYNITETDDSMQKWKNIDFLNEETKQMIEQSRILIIPWDFQRQDIDYSFPVKTEELFEYLKNNIDNPNDVEICINESDYKELALHSEYLWLGSFIVISILIPIFVNLISAYLQKRLINNDPNTIIQINIIIDHGKDSEMKSKKFAFKKPLAEFENFKKDLITYSKDGEIEKSESIGNQIDEQI